jgi:ABC-type branched-subunit amino acid transport system substrate-binding protein
VSIHSVIDMKALSIDPPRTRRTGRRWAPAVVLLVLVAAACGSTPANTASAPGVTPTGVLIGSDQPLTGPAAVGYSEIGPASRAVFRYVNAHGGVNGRTITYTYLDDGYNAADSAKAVPIERQLVNDDHVFAYFNAFGLLTHAAIVDALNAQGVPDLFVGSSCDCWNQPSQHPQTFGFGANYTLEGRLAGSYVARTYPGAKVAYIWEDDAVGCCRQAVAELDGQIPPARVVARPSFTAADLQPSILLGPQLRAAREAGAQVIVLDALAPQATAEVLVADAVSGYHPTIVEPFPLSADPTVVGGFIKQFSGGRLSPSIEDGLVTQAHLPSATDAANPWIRLFRQIHDQYEPDAPFDNMTVYGMSAAALFVQALRQAGQNPTRQSIVSAINSGAVNAAGPGLVPLPYSSRNHDGYTGAQVGSIQNGSLVLSGLANVRGPNGSVTTHAVTVSTPTLTDVHS